MSHGDVSQQTLRATEGLPLQLDDSGPIGYVADVVLLNPSADTVTVVPPINAPFSPDDIKKLAAAMWTQGNWFLGIDVTSRENAMKCSRDLLALLFIMKYGVPVPMPGGPLRPPVNTDGNNWPWDDLPIPPAPPATGVVAGSPGHFLPEGSEPPFDLPALNSLPAPEPDTPWAEGEYVDLGDGSQATWIGFTSIQWHYNLRWNKANPIPNMYYPAEPTITDQTQASADKIPAAGFGNPSVAWASWDLIDIGVFQFSWDGTKWIPGEI